MSILKMVTLTNGNTPLIGSVIAGVITGVILLGIFIAQSTNAELPSDSVKINPAVLVKDGKLTVCKLDKTSYETVKKIKMVITAYSSTVDQTDDTPFITASGKKVKDGIIANNLLPFGTKIRIPKLFGDKIFIVEDRMNKRKGNYHADIWFESLLQAKNFGAKTAEIEIVES